MSIYTTPVTQLKLADVQELLQDGGAVENIRLEFSSDVPKKEETLKKLSSFANTYGGYLIIGAKARSADGRLIDLPGVAPQNNYKQQIIQWCYDGASPPFNIEVSGPIPQATEPGKVYYVVYVPESDLGPHFLNDRKGIWIRTDEFSQHFEAQLATEHELRHLFDRRKLIQDRRAELCRRSRQRFETFLSGGSSGKKPAFLSLFVGPRFPARPVCEEAMLTDALSRCRANWRGAFPLQSAVTVSQHESALLLTPKDVNEVGLVEANIWGMLFYGTLLETEVGTPPHSIKGIYPNRIVGHLLVFLEHARRMLSDWSYAGPLTIGVTLSGIRGVKWYYDESGSRFEGPVSPLDDEFEFSFATDLERETDHLLVCKIMRSTLFGLNWAHWAQSDSNLDSLISAGYKYNNWRYD